MLHSDLHIITQITFYQQKVFGFNKLRTTEQREEYQ